jgi:hypothetical protein
MRHDVEVRQRCQLSVLRLYLGVEQAAVRDSPEVFPDLNEIAHAEVPHYPKHEAGQGVAE